MGARLKVYSRASETLMCAGITRSLKLSLHLCRLPIVEALVAFGALLGLQAGLWALEAFRRGCLPHGVWCLHALAFCAPFFLHVPFHKAWEQLEVMLFVFLSMERL